MQPEAVALSAAVPLPLAVTGVVAAYLALFALGEGMRSLGVPGPTTRKAVHVAAALPALALPSLFSTPEPVLLLGAGFVVLMLLSRKLGLLGSIHDVPRDSLGAVLYPVSVAVAFALVGHDLAYPVAVLALALGDAAAGVVGTRFGRRHFVCWGAHRTLEGSAAACVVTFLASASVLLPAAGGGGLPGAASGWPAGLALSGAVALAVALAEAQSPLGLDNLSVPAAALGVMAVGHSAVAVVALLGLLLGLLLTGLRPWRTGSRPVPVRSRLDRAPAEPGRQEGRT